MKSLFHFSTWATVRARQAGSAQLRHGSATKDITLGKGEVFSWNGH